MVFQKLSSNVLVVAGEVSGDRIAAAVVRQLQALQPDLCFFGAGGPALAAEGVELRHDIDDLAVTGITEALSVSLSAARLLGDLWLQIKLRRPALALLVDYPGINLRLARILRNAGVPVLYYVAPQRWAWLGSRAKHIADRVDELAVTLPFEARWFASYGVRATYVGHPSVDLFKPLQRQLARQQLGWADDRLLVALMPGSRTNEVRRLLPAFARAAELLSKSVPSKPVVAVLAGKHAELCQQLAPTLPQADSETVLGAADMALCASGTATIEATLADVPAVVAYRTGRASFLLARSLLTVPMVGLPNLILGRRLLPELLQDEVVPAKLSRAAALLLEPQRNAEIKSGLREVRELLGSGGSASRAAELALNYL